MNKSFRVFLWALLCVALLGGCATMSHDDIKGAVKKPAPRVEGPNYIFHRVMSGETMGTIARYYTGKESLWREIAGANPDLSPFNLKKGEIVKVPMAIATVNKEQPKYSTARRRTPKTTKQSSGATAVPAQADEAAEGDDEPVFGPK